MDENTLPSVAPANTYLEALKNLPKLPDAPVPADEHTADGWCGPESQPDNVEEQEDVIIDLGLQAASIPMKRKLKGKSSMTTVDPATVQFGPAKASFLSARGDPSSSLVPRKRTRTKPKSPQVPATDTAPDQSEWRSAVFTLRSQLEKLQTLPLPHSGSSPSPELRDVTVDIGNLQKRVSELASIIASRFIQQHSAIANLTTSTSAISSLESTLGKTAHRVTRLEDSSHQDTSEPYRALEVRVAELKKMLVASSASALPTHLPPTLSQPITSVPPAPLSSNIRLQVVIDHSRCAQSAPPWDWLAQMLGCMPALSVGDVTSVDQLPSSPGCLLVTFQTEKAARDFLSAARTLPIRFRQVRFSWADSPSSPVKSTATWIPLPAGPYVDDRHG
ncbi:hypothetical protein IW261DRAFT_1524120 [Armillaria novae-zelandiae]|uniref:Uncharacterized protein n=1 Tax=Armillaria novae-zelandiae TaxID=153914 RepID=A0AA39NFY8_9AGAR|nr:hypothetical protein IW261DRAFT_1524120 [Armillaria novae-zelandiae]